MKKNCLGFFFPFLLLVFMPHPVLGQDSLPALIKKIEPSIVVIFTRDPQGKVLGQGSGFLIDQNGDVITNYHVLQNASSAEIKTFDGKGYPVKKILAEDPEHDLVRVAVDISPNVVQPLPVNINLPDVGERIIIIGTPLGLDKSVSDGIISAVRDIPDFGKVIQLTAPISPGSSGSPVINMKGEVIGIATFYLVAGQNLNFAIPGEKILKMTIQEGKGLAEREESRTKNWIESADAFYAIGLRYFALENCERAIPYFVEAIKRNPRKAEAYFRVGYCLGELKKFQEAIEPYRKAIQINPQDAPSYNNLCMAYAKLGNYEEAIQSCKQAVHLKPDLAEGHNNLGWVYHQLARYSEGMEECRQAIRIQPDFAMAHFNLGNQYAALKKYPEAAESYKQAIRIQPDYAESHLNLGAAYNQMGKFEEAIEEYRLAIRFKPTMAEAYLNSGMTYLKMGDRGAALDHYRILKELNREMANRLFNLIYE
jgi:tetratricopeptide (TPR) repeat protein